ncbi:TBC domain containing protein [Plasmodium gonderi]|uniref:TBC domain containing protein n=1 Tax=Plasmodium gonderi TaxID=77519 RepID=A0A1Y1JIM2_PLAGO|nr:TBC domain containing protein [Plasmodium gonderi]GAW81488.1 TBC domain containing protein [Plasmodium gonderi]
MNNNEKKKKFILHGIKGISQNQWGEDRKNIILRGIMPTHNLHNRNNRHHSNEEGEFFNLKRDAERDTIGIVTQDEFVKELEEDCANQGKEINGWMGQTRNGMITRKDYNNDDHLPAYPHDGAHAGAHASAHAYPHGDENVPTGEHTPDKTEMEKYSTYCEDGYLRSLLKNAVVNNPSLKACIGTKVISFLNEKERHNCSMTCKLLFFEIYSLSNLKNIYKNKFIRSEKRSMIWKMILLAENTYMSDSLFYELKKRNSTYEKIIEKDVPRTFPNRFFLQNGCENRKMQEELFEVLKICSLYFKNVGYCQGMNYVAAIFFLVFKNKLDTIRCFIALLKNFNLKGIYIYNFPQLKKIIYQLNILIKAYIPKLFSYFKKKKIKIDFFCINWFMTLFSQDLTFEHTQKLWDIFFLFGLKILIKLSLIFLHHFQKKILTLSYDQALTFLKSMTKSSFTNYLFEENNFFTYLKKFKVTNRILRQIILLKKSRNNFEILVKKDTLHGNHIRCSLVLREENGRRVYSSHRPESIDQQNDPQINNLMRRFIGMLTDGFDRRRNARIHKMDIYTQNDAQNGTQASTQRGRRSMNCSNFFFNPSYSNAVTMESQCLSLDINRTMLCGITDRSKYNPGECIINDGKTNERDNILRGTESTRQDVYTDPNDDAEEDLDMHANKNIYYAFNLTKAFK